MGTTLANLRGLKGHDIDVGGWMANAICLSLSGASGYAANIDVARSCLEMLVIGRNAKGGVRPPRDHDTCVLLVLRVHPAVRLCRPSKHEGTSGLSHWAIKRFYFFFPRIKSVG